MINPKTCHISKAYDGTIMVHDAGEVRLYRSNFEALVSESKLHLGIESKVFASKEMLQELGMETSQFSLTKNGKKPMPNSWVLRFHVWTGLPLRVVEDLAGIKSKVQPSPRLNSKGWPPIDPIARHVLPMVPSNDYSAAVTETN